MTTPLIIVESEIAAKLMRKRLGDHFIVCATGGHIAALPTRRSAVDAKGNFHVKLEPTARGKQSLFHIHRALKAASGVFIATAHDQRGDEIAGELTAFLKTDIKLQRICLPDIAGIDSRDDAWVTDLRAAIDQATPVNPNLIAAVETQRIIDRLIGNELSLMLWKRVSRKVNAGRAKSRILRLIAEREHKRMIHASSEQSRVRLTTATNPPITATLTHIDGKVPRNAREVLPKEFRDSLLIVRSVNEVTVHEEPPRPYTTETLIRDVAILCSLKFSEMGLIFSVLLENSDINNTRPDRALYVLWRGPYLSHPHGSSSTSYITFPRSRSEALSDDAYHAFSDLIRNSPSYGPNFVRRIGESTLPNVGEAEHECIRPTLPLRPPESIEDDLTPIQLQFYRLIWHRTMRAVMTPCIYTVTKLELEATTSGPFPKVCRFSAEVSNIHALGYRKYPWDIPSPLPGDHSKLPWALKIGDVMGIQSAKIAPYHSLPPLRYTEERLFREVCELDDEEINPLSAVPKNAFMSTLKSLRKSGVIGGDRKSVAPSWEAMAASDFLARHFAPLLDRRFTIRLKERLKSIALGFATKETVLNEFCNGSFEGSEGLKQLIEKVDSADLATTNIRYHIGEHPDSGEEIAVHFGPYGAYIKCGSATTAAPARIAPSDLTVSKAVALLSEQGRTSRVLGDWNGAPITLMHGSRGHFVKWGRHSAPPPGMKRPKVASLLRSTNCVDVSLEAAIQALSFPRKLGRNPFDGTPVSVRNGPRGTYIRSGTRNKALPDEAAAFSITLKEAAAMFRYKVESSETKSLPN